MQRVEKKSKENNEVYASLVNRRKTSGEMSEQAEGLGHED